MSFAPLRRRNAASEAGAGLEQQRAAARGRSSGSMQGERARRERREMRNEKKEEEEKGARKAQEGSAQRDVSRPRAPFFFPLLSLCLDTRRGAERAQQRSARCRGAGERGERAQGQRGEGEREGGTIKHQTDSIFLEESALVHCSVTPHCVRFSPLPPWTVAPVRAPRRPAHRCAPAQAQLTGGRRTRRGGGR